MSCLPQFRQGGNEPTNGSRVTLRLLLLIGGWVISVIAATAGGAWFGGARDAQVTLQLATTGASVQDHESRLRLLETHLVETSNDVKWIRQKLETRSAAELWGVEEGGRHGPAS